MPLEGPLGGEEPGFNPFQRQPHEAEEGRRGLSEGEDEDVETERWVLCGRGGGAMWHLCCYSTVECLHERLVD